MTTITTPAKSHTRRTHKERLFDDIVALHQKMDDLYAIAKIRQAEYEIANGQCKTYDTIKDLIHDLEH